MGDLNTTPASEANGVVINATTWAAEITTPLTTLQAQWVAYTPTWASTGTAPALGNGSLLASYNRVGKTVHVRMTFIPGSSTTFGTGTYTFTVPFNADSSPALTTVFQAQLNGTARWGGQAVLSPGALSFSVYLPTSATDPRLVAMTNAVPETFASGSSLRVTGFYETA